MHELRFLFRIINLTRHDDNKQINSSSLTSMPAIITRELRISPIRLSRYILEKRLLAIVKKYNELCNVLTFDSNYPSTGQNP